MTTEKFDPWARRRARRLLLQALYQWQVAGPGLTELHEQFRGRKEFARIDERFFAELLGGIIEQSDAVDALLEPLLDRKLNDLDQVERALLRAGAFELKGRIDVPYKVVIDEYVSLARTFGAEDSHKYINGVLDRLARSERVLETAADG